MLADTEIADALEAGDLTVGYAFVPNADGDWLYQETPIDARATADGRELFASLSVKSRVALTIGPLVKPLGQRVAAVPRAGRFEGHKSVVDLRLHRDGFDLAPGQACVLLTNEQIDLSHAVGGLIVGRVSSYSDGLVVNASYLDPTWTGLIKLHLHNTAERPVKLRLGAEVARLFLYDTSASSVDPISVAHQGLHYGYSWRRVLHDGIDPFPERARPDQGLDVRHRVGSLNRWLKRHLGYGLIAALGLLAVPALRFYQQADNWAERFDQLDGLERSVEALGEAGVLTGIESIDIGSSAVGTESISVEIPLPETYRYNPDGGFALASADDSDLVVRARIITRSGASFVVLTMPTATDTQIVDVRWLVAR